MNKSTLKPKEERRLLRGHLWAYRNEFQELPDLADGEEVEVYSSQGRLVGQGFYQSQGGIAVRMLSRQGGGIGSGFFEARVTEAAALRSKMFGGQTVYRWIHGEADGLPGFVADRYGSVVNAQTTCTFYAGRAAALAEAFLAQEGVTGFRLDCAGKVTSEGEVPDTLECEVDGVTFAVDVAQGQKTGLFLDQRLNALAVRPHAAKARVLDGHCYAGLWSCHAALGGAAHVHGVDTSAAAIEQATINARLNGVEDRCTFENADISEVLNRDDRYNLIMLDPPALAKSRSKVTKALRLYQALNKQALERIEPGGVLVTSSCSHFVDHNALLEVLKRAANAARRQLTILEVRGAPPDHPMLLSMPETAYLTCVFAYVQP